MEFKEQMTKHEQEIIEKELETLSLSMLEILKETKDKGLIGEEEYKKHIKVKQGYIDFLRKKRNKLFVV